MKMYRRELSPLRGVVCHLRASSSLVAEEQTKSGSTHSRAVVQLAHQINCELLSDCDAIIQKEEGQNSCEKGTWKCLSFVKMFHFQKCYSCWIDYKINMIICCIILQWVSSYTYNNYDLELITKSISWGCVRFIACYMLVFLRLHMVTGLLQRF